MLLQNTNSIYGLLALAVEIASTYRLAYKFQVLSFI